MYIHFLETTLPQKKTINDNSDDGIPVGALAGVGGHGRAEHCPFTYFRFGKGIRDSSYIFDLGKACEIS